MPSAPRPPVGMLSTFSSDMLPEKDRFSQFVEEFARQIVRIDGSQIGEGPFRAQLGLMSLGETSCGTVDVSPGSYGRTSALVTDGNDDLLLFLNRGEPYVCPGPLVVPRGGVHLVDNAQAGSVKATKGAHFISIGVSRRALIRLAPNAEDMLNKELDAASQVAILLRSYVEALLEAGSVPEEVALTAGNHLIDLVALALGARGEAAESAEQRGLRAARYAALIDCLRRNMHDPSLSLTSVAQMNGISERHVQRLLEEHGTSFTEFLLELRLGQAYRALTNPLHRGRRIVDIASDCGFGDLSYFNRSFRRRYGMTPTDARGLRP